MRKSKSTNKSQRNTLDELMSNNETLLIDKIIEDSLLQSIETEKSYQDTEQNHESDETSTIDSKYANDKNVQKLSKKHHRFPFVMKNAMLQSRYDGAKTKIMKKFILWLESKEDRKTYWFCHPLTAFLAMPPLLFLAYYVASLGVPFATLIGSLIILVPESFIFVKSNIDFNRSHEIEEEIINQFEEQDEGAAFSSGNKYRLMYKFGSTGSYQEKFYIWHPCKGNKFIVSLEAPGKYSFAREE